MKRERAVFLLAIFCVAVCYPRLSQAQQIEYPEIEGVSSFAIVTDATTRSICGAQIEEYKKVLEAEGLPTFIVSDSWESPDGVKKILYQFYKENSLEGAVFIGDVPIVMVMHAQFLTTAYKMDEEKNPWEVVAVPSDRFYDDFDLTFASVPDSTKGNHFFYELSSTSLPYIECDIYTGRIVPQKSNGDPYAQISGYLKKVVEAHRQENYFDQFTSYTGHGSYSGCLEAWRAERMILSEQTGDAFKHNNARFIRYNMREATSLKKNGGYMKRNVIRELRRKDLDYMVFHEHGDYDRMYLSGRPDRRNPQEVLRETLHRYAWQDVKGKSHRAKDSAATWGLDSTWYCDFNTPDGIVADSLSDLKMGIIIEEINSIAPNVRFVNFDACYNADFRNPDFIAGKFIMSGGGCVVAFGSSVNVLQDKPAFEFLGLLKEGLRVGFWAKYQNTLESHIIGDPTFHFTRKGAEGRDINEMMNSSDVQLWLSSLEDKNPEIQNIALRKLFSTNHLGISDTLLSKFKNSEYAIVRYEALTMLERIDDKNFYEALKLAVTDRFEFIRRIAVSRMGSVGAPEFLPFLVDAYVNDATSARIVFNVKNALPCFDREEAEAAVELYFSNKQYYNAECDRKALLEIIQKDEGRESMNAIKEGKPSRKISAVKYLRNQPLHQNVEELIELMKDKEQDELLRTKIVESLAWFRLSYKKEIIINACRELLCDADNTPEMQRALESALMRLGSVK